jgi:SAM-dependent methyltransferase
VTPAPAVIWHDLECGLYDRDLGFWLALAADCGGPVLDIGAGTGRVTRALAQAGYEVVALDCDPELLAALQERCAALPVRTVVADARDFSLDNERFPLCLVPMQTIQLLSGAEGRRAMFAAVRAHLVDAGVLAIAIAAEFDEFVWHEGDPVPLPDIVEIDGTIYSSQPTAVRAQDTTVVLERRREVVDPEGGRDVSDDRITLDQITPAMVIADGTAAGLRAVATHVIPETDEHVASQVVIFRA